MRFRFGGGGGGGFYTEGFIHGGAYFRNFTVFQLWELDSGNGEERAFGSHYTAFSINLVGF